MRLPRGVGEDDHGLAYVEVGKPVAYDGAVGYVPQDKGPPAPDLLVPYANPTSIGRVVAVLAVKDSFGLL
jgi:hypothetical protein